MIDFSAAQTNEDKEKDGVWRTWTDGEHEIELLLARAGGANIAFRLKVEELTRDYRRSGVDLLQIPPAKQDEINREAYADTIVKGWRSKAFGGLNAENFNRDGVIHMFKKLPDTLIFAINQSTAANNYRNSALEREAKN